MPLTPNPFLSPNRKRHLHNKKYGTNYSPIESVDMKSPTPYNDINKVKDLLDSFGVGYNIEKKGEHMLIEITGQAEKVRAYPGFYCTYKFDLEGNFIEILILE